jgi:hypothetical protein
MVKITAFLVTSLSMGVLLSACQTMGNGSIKALLDEAPATQNQDFPLIAERRGRVTSPAYTDEQKAALEAGLAAKAGRKANGTSSQSHEARLRHLAATHKQDALKQIEGQ